MAAALPWGGDEKPAKLPDTNPRKERLVGGRETQAFSVT
jgi:hypothetical protein